MKKFIIILLAMFFTNCLAAAPTSSEVNAVLTKYANNPKGWSALNYAIEEGDIEAALILVEHVRDFNKIDDGVDAIHRVFLPALVPEPREIAKAEKTLIKKLIDVGVDINRRVLAGALQTPLTLAIQLDARDIVIYLLDHRANPNIGGPIYQAIKKSDYELVEILMMYGVDINLKRKSTPQSPLLAAVSKGDVQLVHLFLKNNANPNISIGYSGSKNSPPIPVLNLALMKCDQDPSNPARVKIVDLLIEYGAKVS